MKNFTQAADEILEEVDITAGNASLQGDLRVPVGALGLVVFAHGSGSGRHSRRNQAVADALRQRGLGTLLFDLLTRDEEAEDHYTGHLRFNIRFLGERLVEVIRWIAEHERLQKLPLGLFGASTGAAAALLAAAQLQERVTAVVSRGGRPDLAMEYLPDVACPTLLLVGERDEPVIEMNQTAFKKLRAHKEMKIVPRATHLFEEPGALEAVSLLAGDWFLEYFTARN